MKSQASLHQAMQDWLSAKAVEDNAKEARIAAEEAVVAILGCKEEGSETHKQYGYKVTITGRVNRTIDQSAWDSVADKIPSHLSPIKYKPALDLKGLRYLQQNEPGIYRIAAEAITATPGKPSVKIEKSVDS